MKALKKLSLLLLCVLILGMLATLWGGKGSISRTRIKPGMAVGEVLRAGQGWLVLNAVPIPRPSTEAVVNVRPDTLEVHGFGDGEGTFRYRDGGEMARALDKLMQGKVWKFTFGYVAVPRREYFDVFFDKAGKVSSVSPVRPGRLD